jgi:lysophospholipase L1-like esterase
MKCLQIILLTLTVISGCTKKQDRPVTYTSPHVTDTMATSNPTDTGICNYLALGDSYTIGESVPANESYPFQLTNSINVAGFSAPSPTIIAITGWTTDNLIHAIATSNVVNNKYQVVTLLIGVNDQFQGLTQDHYRTNFIQLLYTAIKFANGDSTRVFVLSIPDYGVTPFAMGRDNIIGPQIDQFNAINKEESRNAGVHYLDITGISREAANDPTLIAGDGLHPSGKMYKLWVDQLGPMVVERLQKH